MAPLKHTDTTKMLVDAGLSRLPSPVQLEQGLIDKLTIDKLNRETVDAEILQRPPLLYKDCTWSLLIGDEPEDSLASLGAALRNAAESQRFF